MKMKNGKNNIIKKGKSILLTIFSVFVIFMIITMSISYEYNKSYTVKYNIYKENNKNYKEGQEEFLNNTIEIYSKYKENGSNLNTRVFLSTIQITNLKVGLNYYDITKEDIHIIFKCMNDDPDIEDFEIINYDEESFKKNIKQKWFKSEKIAELKEYSDIELAEIVNDIYDNLEGYEYFFGEEENHTSSTGGVCTYKVGDDTYSNIQIKLLNCEGNTYVEGEDLVEFETYITGVVYQEIGNTEMEAMKAQAVAARSYALKRPGAMNGAYGVKFSNENGKTILSLRSCTNDQVFCHPEKGCWSNVAGGQTGSSSTWSNCTVHSGEDKTKNWSKAKLAENSNIRKAVQNTYGQVAVDSEGKVVYTSYLDTNQKRWTSMAKEGKDYFEIIKKDYPSVASITSTCTSGADTELAKQAITWKQYDSRWGSQFIGTKTIKQVGCMVTSTSIQIARSGTELKVNDFNPGVFVSTVKSNGGFSGNNFNVDDSTWASIAPNFKVGGMIEFTSKDSLNDKMNKMASLINQGYYIIARIYHPGEHWVAITDVKNGKATMADPGSDSTNFCEKYNCGSSNFTRIYYFKTS